MNKDNKSDGNSINRKKKIKFEETNEGQMLLNSISAAFLEVRKENEYIGEFRIMQNLTKKAYSQFPEQQTDSKVAELLKKKEANKTKDAANEDTLSQIYRNNGYIRTNMPNKQ
jgi:transcriptional regulator of aromatic amino acid metabolism